MSELIYPTLDLFLYSIREGLGETEQDLAKRHAEFWQHLPEELKVELSQEEKVDSSEYIRLLEFSAIANHQKQYFQKKTVKGYNLEASYYPVRLTDIYGLKFDCSIDDRIHPQPVSCFQLLQEQAEGKIGNLGMTWMLSGCLSASANAKDIAQEIYKIFTGKDWDNYQQGNFLGATVFQVWQPPQNWQNYPEANSQILIFIYPHLTNMEAAASFYKDWLQMLGYRHKILWAYSESRHRKQELQILFKSLRSTTEDIQRISANDTKIDPTKLQELQQTLQRNTETFANYVTRLGYLEILEQTIATNLDNYKQSLSYLVKRADYQNKTGITELNFLEEFSHLVEHKYRVQITKDIATFSPGIKLLENLTNTVRGIVEIERANRDRQIEHLIAAAGVGLGTASTLASAFSALVKDFTPFYPIKVDKNQLPWAEPLSNLLVVLLLSLVLSWLVGWGTWKYLRSRP
jgi:hypothetical protein